MWAAVEFTHHRGVKLKAGQRHPRGDLQGELVSYTVGQRAVQALALKHGLHGPDVAVLYRPRLVGIAQDVFRISGLERSSGQPPAWVHQEWICRVRERPADVPSEPSRVRRP